MRLFHFFLLVLVWSCKPSQTNEATSSEEAMAANREIKTSPVRFTGAMRNVMHKGDLSNQIILDSISSDGFYGIGPLSGLQGELLLWDGNPYVARAEGDSSMLVSLDSLAGAPFFVYTPSQFWKELSIPDSTHDILSLEAFLNEKFADKSVPFAFRLKGTFSLSKIHIQNLPEGAIVSSPEEAHAGQMDFNLRMIEADILGFHSKKHQGIFTHHDSNIHMHLITADKMLMGHVDLLEFDSKQVQVFVAQ
jgi:acetolactate decarboxylase